MEETTKIIRDINIANAYREGYNAAFNKYIWYIAVFLWIGFIAGSIVTYLLFGYVG